MTRWPGGNKPLQLLTRGEGIRSVHGTAYTRQHDADLVGVLKEYATDFTPPQAGFNGATGLYCGEQDLFCFLIDPTGWAEIDGEAFAPGFFVWNSEVGKRSVGIRTFWFQKVCANHIVWDAVEVIEFAPKRTARVGPALDDIRRPVEGLVATRDEFAAVIEKAMRGKLGSDAEEVMKALANPAGSRSGRGSEPSGRPRPRAEPKNRPDAPCGPYVRRDKGCRPVPVPKRRDRAGMRLRRRLSAYPTPQHGLPIHFNRRTRSGPPPGAGPETNAGSASAFRPWCAPSTRR